MYINYSRYLIIFVFTCHTYFFLHLREKIISDIHPDVYQIRCPSFAPDILVPLLNISLLSEDTPVACLLGQDCQRWILSVFLYLKMSLFHPHFWGIFPDTKFWVVSSPPLQCIKNIILHPSHLRGFCWEIHTHSNHCSLCETCWFSLAAFKIICLQFVAVWLWCIWAWISLSLICLGPTELLKSVRLCLSQNLGAF